MDKPFQTNGFSLMEMLIVLLIVSVFSFSFMIPKDNLLIFMNDLLSHSIICQEKAFTDKRNVSVQFDSHAAYFDSIEFVYPHSISCSNQSFHYNEKGNISKACSVTCSNGKDEKKIIYQLGSGRVRIDD